jgi:hypothetical protein
MAPFTEVLYPERRHWVTGRFKLEVLGPASNDDLRQVVNTLVQKGESNHQAKGVEPAEQRSLDQAVFFALSYLGDAPGAVWQDVCNPSHSGTYMRERVDFARVVGPGGKKITD